MSLDAKTLDEIRSVRWFHRIDLGHGVTTPGPDDTRLKLEQVRLPEDLSGKSVLDIGAWDGFFSFEAERRGARRVVAVDHDVWVSPDVGPRGFNLARRVLGSRVEPIQLNVRELSPEAVGGTFDLVLFLGVLYHVRDPLGSLERVASVTGDQLILETHVDLVESKRPALAFYPGDECADDPSNWFGPNPAAVVAMLKEVGFRKVEVNPTILDKRWPPHGRLVKKCLERVGISPHRRSVLTPLRLLGMAPGKPRVGYGVVRGEASTFGRAVFHAWK